MNIGYLNQNVLIQLKMFADKTALDTARIGDIISSFLSSYQVRAMSEGDKYYNGEHDILDAQRFYYIDKVKQQDTISANNKIPHPFLSILIDQKASKVCGKPISISVSGGDVEFKKSLEEQLGTIFDDKVYDWVVGASKHSMEWLHLYVNPRGELKYIICPSTQIIPVYDTQYENELLYVIRFYQYELINDKGEKQNLYKVEWWTKTDVTYWVQIENGSFVMDSFYTYNPMPHWFDTNDTTGTKESHGWGKVPFVGLMNNSRCRTDLAEIKPLIDAYDKVVSGWCNDLEDFAEQILIIKNLAIHDKELYAGMSELSVMMQNLKERKVVIVEGDGEVKNLKTEIPVEAKEKFLQLIRKAIFYFGKGVDSSAEVIGNSPSGVALQHLYALLDMKSNDIIVKLKVALKDFFWFVTEYINNKNNKNYDPNMVIATFNTSQMFNKKELIDGIKERVGFLSNETLLGLDPDVNDVAVEMERLKKQKAEEQAQAEKDLQNKIRLVEANNKQNVGVPTQ